MWLRRASLLKKTSNDVYRQRQGLNLVPLHSEVNKMSVVPRTSPKASGSQALEEILSESREENVPNWHWLKCKVW